MGADPTRLARVESMSRSSLEFATLGLGLALVASLLVFLTSWLEPYPALAHHGSWTHHHNVVWEEGTSQYGGYANVGASSSYDFGHVSFEVRRGSTVVFRDTVTCWGPMKGCGYRRTPTAYWAQTASTTYSTACAKGGDHKLSGFYQLYDPCSPAGVPLHNHTRTFN
jgi:hypothetical protein